MCKKIWSLLLTLVAVLSLQAAVVTPQQAHQIAQSFLLSKGKSFATLSEGPQMANTLQQPYYLFNAAEGAGFVLVAGNDKWGSILGYSDNGSCSLSDAPEALKDLLHMYELLMQSDAEAMSAGATPEVIVEPLLGEIAWTQDTPYNDQCPTYLESGTTKHYYVGCVATAMAQIMRHHQYPAQGTGTKTYTSNVGVLSANFGATTYDWANMPERLDQPASAAQSAALSTLCLHAGIAVEMTYEKAGSGAYSQYVAGALKQYFGYAKSAAYVARNYYSTAEWMAILKDELNAGRPVFYSASSDAGTGGHAFVADGYDSNDFVHINWGWGGKSNGFFMINALNPNDLGIGAGAGGYNLSQEMVIGIEPKQEGLASGQPAILSSTRMAGIDAGDSFQLMAYVENDDVEDFHGTLGAALVKDGEIVKILRTMPLELNGVTQTTRINIDARYTKMEGISKQVSDVANGSYQLRYAFKGNDDSWFVLRHPQGLPAYLDAKVYNGYLSAQTHEMKPDATLLSQITPDGDIFANGIARLTLSIRNNSSEMPLSQVALMLTPKAGGEKVILTDKQGSQRIYDGSEKTITLLCDVPADLTPGQYNVDAIESKFEAYPFDCTEVGQTVLTILPEADGPVIRPNTPYYWSSASGAEAHQSETLMATAALRNYATEGSVGLLMKLRTENEEEYPFFLINKNFAKGEVYNAQFARRLDVDPGTYELKGYYVTADGTEHAMEGGQEATKLTVAENPNLALVCEELTLPAEIVQGEKHEYSIRLRALQNFTRTFYIRLRQYTNTKGEIVYMKSGLSMKAGDTTTLTFSYKPGIECGAYFPILETKVDSNTYEAVGGYANYHKDYRVVETSGIDHIHTSDNLPSDAIYTITGQRVSTPQRGIYIVGGKKCIIK